MGSIRSGMALVLPQTGGAAMTPYCPSIPKDAVYRIGEAAKLLGMSRRWLLDRAKAHVIAYSTPNGRTKRFRGADIIKLWRKEQGFST